ncbi:hypothetical protein FB473_001018 [Brooklawnia cerclae]|uniref:Uncharacterized protein n=1 Tax=Brooklawnia cerclae TaxID=349934 RepID=A0ABX0SD88_9ACTN|nr:hypothetical protein [Brooklawnia cerclae]
MTFLQRDIAASPGCSPGGVTGARTPEQGAPGLSER